MTMTFATLGLPDRMVTRLKEEGLTEPTEIQEKALPVLLSGRDLVGQAQTGTGKTLAYILPILTKLKPDLKQVQALFIAPTRELALQISKEVEKYGSQFQTLAVYGGKDVEKQIKQLHSQAQIVVGTPGRLMDHLRRKTLDLSQTRFVALDEADQMLEMGFVEDVEAIIAKTPSNRQSVLLSATMPPKVRHLARKILSAPEEVTVKADNITAETVKQIVMFIEEEEKLRVLVRMIEVMNPYLGLVFCKTKEKAQDVALQLGQKGVNCEVLHGDLSQNRREQVMKKFREAEIQILVATDIAARGIDVEGVTHVFSYDLPHQLEWYVHRIGRTGRAGQQGTALTFVKPNERAALAWLEKRIGLTLERQSVTGQVIKSAKIKTQKPKPIAQKVKAKPSRFAQKVKAKHSGRNSRSSRNKG